MKISSRLLIAALWVSVASMAHAQRINAYVSAGATASQIEGDELKGFDKWGLAGSVGAIASITDNGRWFASLETGYARRGAFNNSGDPYNAKFVLDYIDIPFTVYFKDPYGGILVGLGPVYSRLVQQRGEMAINPEYFVPDTSDLTFLKNDLAIALELRFPIWRGLQMSLRYQYSVIAIKKDWQFTEHFNSRADQVWKNNCYNSSAMIRLLWQFGTPDDIFSSKHKRD